MSIRIEGRVARPIVLTVEQLATLPGQVADVSTLVEGRRGTAVRLASVLEAAAVSAGAAWLTIESDDGAFSASVPLAAAGEAVLVHSLDGAALPRAQGGPVRMLIPDAARCGVAEVDRCANVKFVGVLRLESERGQDNRPTTRDEHAELHRREREGHSH